MNESTGHGLDFSKLPAIDKADIAAVRSFLPGKLLGRTAAFLMLVLLVLAWAGAVDWFLQSRFGVELQPPWLRFGLLFGVPLLIVACHLLLEWVAARNRSQAQALAMTPQSVPGGYFRIGPYLNTPEDRERFDRADRAHNNVLEWLLHASNVPLYITGDSGSGKSSLLNAFVLPGLRERQWTTVEVRPGQDPEPPLRDALAERSGRPKEPAALRALLETAVDRADGRLLVVLDQFEEFLILGTPEAHRAFAALLADLQAQPVDGLRFLLVLRSDYQTMLDDIGLPALRQGENWCQVGRFIVAASRGFMERSGLGLQGETLDRILASAAELDDSPGLIRPITLNVVGHVLAEGRTAAPAMDAGKLVQDYIRAAVEQPAIRDYARPVLASLLTEQGTKKPCSEEELVSATKLRRGEVRAVLNGLAAAALARPLDPAHSTWELAHDFVARAATVYLGRRRRDLWRRVVGYAGPALLLVGVATTAVYEVSVAGPERERRLPIYRAEEWARIEPGEFCMGSRAQNDPPG